MNTNKLQFLHHSSPFQTVEEAKGYVLNLIGDGSLRLAIGEPLVLVYGQTDDLSALIGMGTKEDGTGVFFIDQDADVADIRRIKTILANVVSSCGFDENGRLKPFSGEIISGSSNVEDAIEELASHIKAMSLAVSDTKTVDLTLANRHGESGLTADVRVPRTIMMGGNILTNTLQVGDDGLYVYVDIAHTLGTNKFKMTINDQVKEIDLEDTVKSGVYDNAMKSIILTLNNNNKVYINLQEIFNEFKASNIVCWLPGGEKSNLQSVVSSGGVVSNFESANETNIIRSVGGLFASVNLSYNALTNTLVFTKSDKDEISKVTEIQLNSASVLDHIYYDRTKEELVLIYHTTDGQRQEVRIPISDLFEEWYTDNSNSTVTLVKDRSVQGYTSLKGNVNVAPLSLVPHNILQEFHNAGFHGLSVNGVAENIAYGNGTVKDALDTMSVDLATEVAARENADNALQNALVAETNARTQADTELRNAIVAEINERERIDSGLSNAIQAEIVARENADNELRRLISAETVARENADSALRTDLNAEIDARQSGDTVNAQAIEAEESRARTEEGRLAQLISEEAEARQSGDTVNTQAIEAEESRARAEEGRLAQLVSEETAARESADTVNAQAIEAEESRARAEEGRLAQLISEEAEARQSGDAVNAQAIEAEESRARTEEGRLAQLISEETAARESADTVNAQAIEAEESRARAEEGRLTQLISEEAETRQSGDAVNAQAIEAEESRARTEEGRLAQLISEETAARESADTVNAQAIEAEENRAKGRENELADMINRNKVTIEVPREEVYLQKEEDSSDSGTVYTLSTSGIASQAALATEVAERTANDTALSNNLGTAFGKIDELNQTVRGAQLEVSGDSVINAWVESDGPLVKTIYINANIDPDEHNIIQSTDDGLFARVQLEYDETTNTLTFDNGILEPTQIHLMGGSLISGITYDSSTNSLVIVYEVATESGTSVEEVSIPVSDFFKPIVPDNRDRTTTVTTGTTTGGNQTISVDVNVSTRDDNMLQKIVTSHGTTLFVDGAPIQTVNEKVNELDTQVRALSGVVDEKQDKDFVIQMVKTGSTQTDISADTSLADAFSAAEAGKNVVVEYTGQARPKMRLNLCHWSVSMVSAMTFGTTSYEMNGKTAYTGIFWFNDNYDIISEVYTEIQEPLSAGTGLDITNNVISLTAQTGGNYSGASGVTLERDGVTFRGEISRRSEPYLQLESEGFLLSGVTSAITTAKDEAITSAKNYADSAITTAKNEAITSAKNYADSAISSAISSGDFAHLNKVGSLATGEEQKLVLPWVDSRTLPTSGTVYNTETHQIETYLHGEIIFAESPSENVVYCRISDNTLWRWNGTTMEQISTGGGGGTDIHVSGVTVVTVSGGVDSEGDSVQESNGVYLKTVFEGSNNKIYTPLSSVVTFQNSESITFSVNSGNVVTAEVGVNGVLDCGDYYNFIDHVNTDDPELTGATQHTGATEHTGTTGEYTGSTPFNP